MRNKILSTGALAFAATLAFSTSAGALVISGSYNGTLNTGSTDTYGFFGTPGGSLDGQTVTIDYSYDTSLLSLSGNASFDALSCTSCTTAISVQVTVGGITFTASSTQQGQVIVQPNGAKSMSAINAYVDVNGAGAFFFVYNDTPFVDNGLLTTPLAVLEPNPNYGLPDYVVTSFGNGNQTQFFFTPSPSQQEAPEPATIALFGTGLAAIGAIRRRKG